MTKNVSVVVVQY